VLGSVLIDNTLLATVTQYLKPAHFYDAGHRSILEAMRRLEAEGSSIDPTTLCEALRREGKLDLTGGPSYIALLESAVLSTSNVAAHARIVLDKALKRELIKAADAIARSSYEEEADAEGLLARAQQDIYNIQEAHIAEAVRPIDETVREVLDLLEERRHHSHIYTGLSSGYSDLDDLTSGFQKSDLIILAGRTSMGKTAFALCIASHVAVRQRKPVLFFSLEMSRHQLAQRLIAMIARKDLRKIRAPRDLSAQELDDITEAGRLLGSSPLLIDDTPGIDIADIRARARHHKARNSDLALVVVDYLQLITCAETAGRRSDSRQVEVARISGALKGLARDLNVPLIALAQLSRQVEQRRGKDKSPILSDLRESGAIEQDSDLVIFVHRPDFYTRTSDDADKPETDYSKAQILVRKHRNGRVGEVDLLFHGPTTSFVQEIKH